MLITSFLVILMLALVLDSSGVHCSSTHRSRTHRSSTHPEHPRSGEIPIRVLRAGICETDLQLVQGYMDFEGVLGHEFVGIAESGRFAGQRVCGEINCGCHHCEVCRRGMSNHCPHRTVLGILGRDGAFAEWVWLPEENLHAVPAEISTDEAVFVEPVAAAFEITRQLDVSQFRQVVVLGDGRLGNLCAQVLHRAGCNLFVIGKHAKKLALLEALGIGTCLLADLPHERFADLAVDCTGSPTGLPTACGILRPRGTLVLKTTTAASAGPNLAPVVIDELTVIGSRCGPFAPALAALAAKQVEVAPLITSRFPLWEGLAALEHARRHDQLKVLLDVSAD